MSTVEATVNKVAQDSLAQQTLAETNKALLENFQTVSKQLAESLKTQAKLERQVAKLMVLTSPASVKKAPSVDVNVPPLGICSTKRALDVDGSYGEVDSDGGVNKPPPKQMKPAAANDDDAFNALDGIAVSSTKTTDITIASELERLHSLGVFQAKKEQAAKNNEVVLKRALFDEGNRYYFGGNPCMSTDTKGGKSQYTHAMTIAAIAFDSRLWEKMFSESLEEVEVRKIAAAVHKSAMAWIKDKEIKYIEGRNENSQFRDLKKPSFYIHQMDQYHEDCARIR